MKGQAHYVLPQLIRSPTSDTRTVTPTCKEGPEASSEKRSARAFIKIFISG